MKAIQKSRTPSEYFRITPLSLHQNILRYELANGLTQSKDVGSFDPEHFTEESEMNLIKKIGEFEEKVEQAALRRKPHIIANYAHDLSNTFNKLYNDVKILDGEKESSRLNLVKGYQTTVKNAFGLLGIDVPETM